MAFQGRDKKKDEALAWRAILGLILAGTAGLILVTGVIVHVLVRDFTARVSGNVLRPFSGGGDLPPGTTAEPGVTPLPELQTINPQPWDGSSRVTLLVMGLDYRDWETGTGAPRSDSMMLVTIDPITHQAGMLSIPRDLWWRFPASTTTASTPPTCSGRPIACLAAARRWRARPWKTWSACRSTSTPSSTSRPSSA